MDAHYDAVISKLEGDPASVGSERVREQLRNRTTSDTAEDAARNASRFKTAKVIRACDDGADRGELIALSTAALGLGSDEVRRRAWPIILGIPSIAERVDDDDDSWRALPPHRDEDQVRLDVHRSFIYYPTDESERQIDSRKAQLSDVIVKVLRKHPALCYFQGFHDIVQVFLLVLGPQQATLAVEVVALLRIRDFMLPSMTPSLAHLRLLPVILSAIDPNLCRHLSTTQPFFALAATLTLYAHDIQEYADIARLFDFLLAQPAVMSIYFFAVIVLARKKELLDIPEEEPEMLHSVLSKLPKPLDLELLISQSVDLFRRFPPEKLPGLTWLKVSRKSVLKTTRHQDQLQTLEEGELLFRQQATAIRNEEWWNGLRAQAWKQRRRIASVGLTLIIGVLAYWLQSYGNGSIIGLGAQKFWGLLRVLRR